MKTLLAIGMIAFVAPLAGGETRLGTGVTLKDSTPIKSILEQPATYVGKTIRIDGVATAVCAHMGCWMAVAAEGPVGTRPRGKAQAADDQAQGRRWRHRVPVSAKGRKVSAEGVFEAVGGRSRDAAQEHAKHDPKASQSYQLKATGAIIQ